MKTIWIWLKKLFNLFFMKQVIKLRNEEPVMTHEPVPRKVKVEKPVPPRLPAPKRFRRDVRARKNQGAAFRPDGKPVGTGKIMGVSWDSRAVYTPKRKKLKGWQRENRRYRKIS
jgi:hypothetical protein